MARRSPARLLAPLALVGFVVALLLVINGAGSDDGSSKTSGSGSKATATATPTRKEKARKLRRRYTVKAGDTPSGIAEKTGVPLSTDHRAQPRSRRSDADRRRQDQAAPMIRAFLPGRRARRRAGARPRRERAVRRHTAAGRLGAERARRRGLDGGRRVRQGAQPPPPDRLGDEADDRAADARAQPPLGGLPRRPLPRPAGRVEDQPAARRADDGRRPAARAADRVGQRRGRHARRARRGLAPSAS